MDKLILRHPTSDDANAYANYIFDEVVAANFMSIPSNVQEAKEELLHLIVENEGQNFQCEHFVIEWNGEFAGMIDFSDIKFGQARLSYWIAKPFRGKGIATKATIQAVDDASKKYALVRVFGFVRTFNKASARVLEKAGFELEGVLRKNKFKDGEYLDDMLYAKIL